MNCIQASRVKGGSVASVFNLNFGIGAMVVSGSSDLKKDTSYRETCRAHNGLLESDYCIRGLACDKRHIFNGGIYTSLIDFGAIGFFGRCRFLDYPGYISPYVWRVYINMDLFGGDLPYFETRLNAYGRQSKSFYENNPAELQKPSPSKSTLLLNAWDPETETGFAPNSSQAYIRWTPFSYAVGNNVEHNLTGTVSIFEYITDTEDPYWSESDYPYNGTGKRAFSNIEVYGG
jgi:hypothetical protein